MERKVVNLCMMFTQNFQTLWEKLWSHACTKAWLLLFEQFPYDKNKRLDKHWRVDILGKVGILTVTVPIFLGSSN